jgi:asparagine synthase (glutamine-hydrolysing)
MCGIAGWVDWERDLTNERHIVEKMGQTLTHRGPDTRGLWVSKSAAFAHQRLIVVDPAGGAQPMSRTFGDNTYTIIYNGELYNTEEIRKDLLARGYNFMSYSDTEVLLVSYVEWGPACVERLNGIFAFGIWDESCNQLFLARDRLGVKPLFYSRKGSSFLFASEIKALLANPLVSRKVDKEGLAEIFAIGPARTPGHGIFKDVSELRAGHCLVARMGKDTIYPYWQLQSSLHEDDLETTTSKVRELMVDTVTRQLVSDVPVATFLSGGLDSSVVSAITARDFANRNKPPLHTYSIEFADMESFFQANDFQKSLDAPWARRVSDFIGTVHHPIVFDTKELVNELMNPLYVRDVPGMADIDTSLFMFCRRIKEDVTVALSGESADEVFGGYPWFHRQESLEADTFPWSLRLNERVKMMSEALKDQIDPYSYVQNRYQEAISEVPKLNGENPKDARIREISYLSITRFLPTLLDRKDRMSMGSGLEVRVPFCDHRIVEYVFNIPWSIKTAGDQVKGILRRAMKGYLQDDALERKKSPYPSTPHPDYLYAVRQHAMDVIDNPTSPILPLIDTEAIRNLAKQSYQTSEHRPWFGQIMGTAQMFHYLFEVNAWLETYKVELV